MKIILSLWMLCVVAVCAIAMPEQLRNVKPDSLKELEDPFGSVMPAYWEAWDITCNPNRTPEEELKAAKIFALMMENQNFDYSGVSMEKNAAYKLATLFETGKVVRNDQEALKLYKRLAADGDGDALYRLGCLYDIGKIVKPCSDMARTYYSMYAGAESSLFGGGSKGRIRLANMYYSRIFIGVGYPQAFEMYQSIIGDILLLESNDPPYNVDVERLEEAYSLLVFAACRIAHMHGHGMGTEQDASLSRQWYQRADKMDMIRYFIQPELAPALEIQQEIYACSQKAEDLYSEAKDPAKRSAEHFASIRKLCERAAELGYESPALRLGWYLEEGSLEPQSHEEFAKLYQLIGNNPLALYRLAVMHLEGRGVKQDEKKAFELLKRSVERSEENFKAGNPIVSLPAFYRLAEMYLNGAGFEKNPEEAQRLITRTEDIPHDRNIPAHISPKYQ